MKAHQASRAVDSIERYMLVLVLGVFTAIFFNIFVAGLVAVSERSVIVFLGAAIVSQTVYAIIDVVIAIAFALVLRDLASLSQPIIDNQGSSVFSKYFSRRPQNLPVRSATWDSV